MSIILETEDSIKNGAVFFCRCKSPHYYRYTTTFL